MEQRPAGKRAKKLTGRDDTLFFVHIPRSGGTALRHMMERVVERSDEWRVYDWQTQQEAIHAERATIARYRLVVGHFRIGVWAPFADQPLVTVLREPMGRMQSSYRYNRMFPNQLLHQAANQMDFDAFVSSEAGRSLSNHQTYQLSTRVPSHDVGGPEVDRQLTRVDVAEALGYLAQPGVLGGLTEESDRAVALLSVMLDIEPPALVTANSSSGPKAPIDPRTVAEFQENNPLDIELYQGASELFWDKWRQAGDSAATALEWVRRKPNWRQQMREWQIDGYRRANQAARRLVGR
jgi:hypothetical protein